MGAGYQTGCIFSDNQFFFVHKKDDDFWQGVLIY